MKSQKDYSKSDSWVVLLKCLFSVFLRGGVKSFISEIILLKVVAGGAQSGGILSQIVTLKSVFSNLGIGLTESVLRIIPWHESLISWNGLILGWKWFLEKSKN